MEGGLGHEKLRVYQHGLDHTAWMHTVLAGIDQSAVVLDHWYRAAESIMECAMRVAACLDVLVARRQIQSPQIAEGKHILASIVPLVLGLRGYLDDSEPKTSR